MAPIKTCPMCGSKKIRRIVGTLRREYRGKPYEVPKVEYDDCPNCGERFFDPIACSKIDSFSQAFKPRRRRKSA